MTNQDHIWHILDDVLLLLAGQHYPTPERTYKLDGGWSLALADLKACFADLRAKLAVVEAERDAAQASDAIISRIKEERRLQDRKWGGSTYDDKHSLGDWAHLIDQRTATLYRAPEHKVAKQELIEVAALAIAALESLWRNREGK